MSQIVLDISAAHLGRPGVAKAVARLVLALGGHAFESTLPLVAAPAPVSGIFLPAGWERFFNWLGERQRGLQWSKLFAKIKKAGSEGFIFEELMVECFPELQSSVDPYRATGGTIGALSRWCREQLGHDLPFRRQDGRLYVDESVFPVEAANDDKVSSVA